MLGHILLGRLGCPFGTVSRLISHNIAHKVVKLIFPPSYYISETVCVCVLNRRQELRELRLLQKEEQRAQQQLSNKLQQQREQISRRFEQETVVGVCTDILSSHITSKLRVHTLCFFHLLQLG